MSSHDWIGIAIIASQEQEMQIPSVLRLPAWKHGHIDLIKLN